MRRQTHNAHDLCGPGCRYKSLYEGSQKSLTDLAARQADALSRLGRLRSAIVLGIKRILPVEFAEAERAMGRRLSDVEDDLLAAYLESFLALAAGRTPPGGSDLARLRSALEGLGVNIAGAFSIADLARAVEASQEQPGLDDLFNQAPPLPRTLTPPAQAPVQAQQNSAQPIEPPAPEPTADDYPPGYDEYQAAPEDYTPDYTPDYAHDTEPPPPPAVATQPSAAPAAAPTPLPTPQVTIAAADEFLEPAPMPTPLSARPTQDNRPVASSQPTPAPATPEIHQPQEAPQKPPHDLDDLFADEPETPSVPAPKPAPASTTRSQTKSPTPQSIKAPWATAPEAGIKPQLIPTAPKTRTRATKKVARTTSTPATPPADTQPSTILDDETRARLLAAICIPRPVFSADLVDLIQSEEVVSAWESEWTADRELSVRFIAPKARHKMRGSLVFPQKFLQNSSAEFKRSLWARVLTEYRGAKLYELGVLLHRFGEEVISDELGTHAAIFRLSRPQGLVGVVVVMDSSLGEGGEAREALVEAMEILLRERLVQIAVVSINAELLDSIEEVVSEEARSRSWVPTAPVTLSKSWEFASGTGVALPLLGA